MKVTKVYCLVLSTTVSLVPIRQAYLFSVIFVEFLALRYQFFLDKQIIIIPISYKDSYQYCRMPQTPTDTNALTYSCSFQLIKHHAIIQQ